MARGFYQIPAITPDLAERFEERVERAGANQCWHWRGAKSKKGYGMLCYAGKNLRAHRLSYTAAVGEIPVGLVIDHLCRNPACVNPAHLEPVTSGENTRRGMAGPLLLARTHCRRGHEFTPENTINPPLWDRYKCRACLEAHRARRRFVERKTQATSPVTAPTVAPHPGTGEDSAGITRSMGDEA